MKPLHTKFLPKSNKLLIWLKVRFIICLRFFFFLHLVGHFEQCGDVTSSLLGPTLGNLFMLYFENISMGNYVPHFKRIIRGSPWKV